MRDIVFFEHFFCRTPILKWVLCGVFMYGNTYAMEPDGWRQLPYSDFYPPLRYVLEGYAEPLDAQYISLSGVDVFLGSEMDIADVENGALVGVVGYFDWYGVFIAEHIEPKKSPVYAMTLIGFVSYIEPSMRKVIVSNEMEVIVASNEDSEMEDLALHDMVRVTINLHDLGHGRIRIERIHEVQYTVEMNDQGYLNAFPFNPTVRVDTKTIQYDAHEQHDVALRGQILRKEKTLTLLNYEFEFIDSVAVIEGQWVDVQCTIKKLTHETIDANELVGKRLTDCRFMH